MTAATPDLRERINPLPFPCPLGLYLEHNPGPQSPPPPALPPMKTLYFKLIALTSSPSPSPPPIGEQTIRRRKMEGSIRFPDRPKQTYTFVFKVDGTNVKGKSHRRNAHRNKHVDIIEAKITKGRNCISRTG